MYGAMYCVHKNLYGYAHVRWYDEYGYCWAATIDKNGRQINKWQYGNTRLPEGETKPRW